MPLYGFDIGKDQWGIDVSLIPHDFAIIGASDGGAVNPVFHQQYATEKALGKGRGAYHYYRGNALAEAAFFVANAGEVPGDGQIWCDAETYFPDLPRRTLAWLEEVRRLTGVRPAGAYTPADFILNRGLDWSPVHDAGYELWEAAYVLGYEPVPAYSIPNGRMPVPLWGAPCMWQFTSSGQVRGWGSGIDLNIFYGDRAAFDALVGGVTGHADTITPITPPEEPDMKAILATDGTSPDVWIGDGITRRKIATLDTLNAVTYLKDLFGLDTTVQTVPDLWALGYPVDQGIESNAADINTNIKGVPLAVLEATFAVGAGGKANVAGALGQLLSTPVAVPAGTTVDVAALAAKLSAILPPAIVSALAAKLSQP